ncbi:efflux transporter outer membrane subunit [Steroidobacter sp.]|uniref:efflux transporter outer membrane subunit n=1 Tax=Steroidobacter sp. TaxID=1978227 RepID=UPI001A5AAF2B|nr:efflux transporter outer membrane subunit [Steroidobacter sp.]MBL8271054.1 efflux transporter outer membrane subunit [Steroidobacter sp.]
MNTRMNSRMLCRVSSVVALAVLAACSQPVKQLPGDLQSTWVDEQRATTVADDASLTWWKAFDDVAIDQLVDLAQQRNLDLRVAEARVREVRAQRRAALANLAPQIDASVDGERSRSRRTGSTTSEIQDSATAGATASWEIDLFGRLRAESRAADAELRAVQADRDGVRLALIAEVIRNYLDYRLYQVQTELSVRNAQAQEETVRITQARFNEGFASRLDLERTVSSLRTTRAQIPQSRELAESARYRLILLTASAPEALSPLLPASTELSALPDSDAESVLLTPADVIAHRPDVRAAERRLIVAAEQRNVAAALRYPRITLAGLIGVEDERVSDLLDTGTRTWSVSGGLLAPLIDFGRIRAAIDAADAVQEQAYLTYEQTARTALQETQTALVLYTQGKLRQQELTQAAESARRAAQLARRQYTAGALSLLEVLDAERSVYSVELDAAQATADVSIRLVNVYESMGLVPPAGS